MTKDRLLFLLSFAVLGIAAALLFRPHQIEVHTQPQKIEALVAVKELKVHEHLTPNAYSWQTIDIASAIPSLIYRSAESEKLLAEATVVKDVHKGEEVKSTDLEFAHEPTKVEEPETVILPATEGKRAVPYPLASMSPIVQFMDPGKYVDVIFASKSEIGFGNVSVTLLRDIKILGIGRDADGKNVKETRNFNKGGSIEILLEMTPRQAEILSYATETGNLSFDINDEPHPDKEEPNQLSQILLKSTSAGNFHSALVTFLFHSLFPAVELEITATPRGYIVSGNPPDQKTAEKILEILDKLSPGGNRAVVNMMEVQQQHVVKPHRFMLPVSPGKRAVPFDLQNWSSMSQVIRPGMFVDITFNSRHDIGFGAISLTLLKNIRILAVQRDGTEHEGKEPPTEGAKTPEVLLEMTPRQAEILFYAKQTGNLSFDLNQGAPSGDEDDLAKTLLNSNSASDFHSTLVTHMFHTLFPQADINITATPKGYIVAGKVSDPQLAGKIMEILVKLAPGGDQSIVNLMEVEPQQVLICVKVFEVQTEVASSLGLNWQALLENSGQTLAFAATFPRPLITDPNYFINAQGIRAGKWTLSAIVDMLETDGYGRILAEPNLTTIVGTKAEFFAGGEFPILIPQGGTLAGTVTVDYKKYGVQLNFTPLVDLNGLITLHIVPEVSELDKANSVTLSGFVIPALTTRRADTIVKLWPGQSYVIGGLLLNQIENVYTNLYGLDKIPLIGPLFCSKVCDDKRTELMILVTPYLMSSEKPIMVEQPVCEESVWEPCDSEPEVWQSPSCDPCDFAETPFEEESCG